MSYTLKQTPQSSFRWYPNPPHPRCSSTTLCKTYRTPSPSPRCSRCNGARRFSPTWRSIQSRIYATAERCSRWERVLLSRSEGFWGPFCTQAVFVKREEEEHKWWEHFALRKKKEKAREREREPARKNSIIRRVVNLEKKGRHTNLKSFGFGP